jgi:Phosphate ATP-binding cassette transporter.
MNSLLFLLIILLALTSYFFGRKKAFKIKTSNKLQALPQFYGYYLALWAAAPALILFFAWSIFEPSMIKNYILSDYVEQNYSENELTLTYEKVKSLAAGNYTGALTSFLTESAKKYGDVIAIAFMAKFIAVMALLISTLSFGYTRISRNVRTREPTEKFLEYLLLFASFAAKMTTVGIVFSLPDSDP